MICEQGQAGRQAGKYMIQIDMLYGNLHNKHTYTAIEKGNGNEWAKWYNVYERVRGALWKTMINGLQKSAKDKLQKYKL